MSSSGPSVVAMPSRHQKSLRDSKLTCTSFNKTGSSSSSCCPGHNHNHATSSSKPGAVDFNKATNGPGDEVSTSMTCSSCKERRINFTAAKSQELNTFSMLRPTVSVPVVVTQALELALKQINDVPAMADPFPPMETFDLENLGEVAKAYDELCKLYKDKEEHELATLSELVGDLAVTAIDANRSSADRCAAELDIHHLNLYSKITVPLTSCLCQIQLFNVEKKFGLLEESYQVLDNDDRKQRGEDVPAELPLSLRQRWSNTFNLTKPISKPDEKSNLGETAKLVKESTQGEKTGKKFSSGIDTLVELQLNCKLAIEAMQDLKETVSNAEKPVELPSLPTSFRCAEVPLPEQIPDHIRQRLLDRESAIQELAALTGKALGLLCHVSNVFAAWCSVSHEAWEFGKKHIHEMPLFREYEYTRLSLHAIFYTASRQEVKIVEFYSGRGAPRLPRAIKKAFRLRSLSLEEFEKYADTECLELQDAYPSVDKIMAIIDEALNDTAEQGSARTEMWRLLSDNPQ